MKRIILLVISLSFVEAFAQESKELIKLKQQTNASVTLSKSTANPNFIRFGNASTLQLRGTSSSAKVADFLASNF